MRVENKHAHAYTRYKLLTVIDFYLLVKSIYEYKKNKYKSLTIHLPYEIQHKEVENIQLSYLYIYFGEFLKKITNTTLYWENAPWLNYGTWDLKYKNTNWKKVPNNIDLCLDTGHLMLGENKASFYFKLNQILKYRGKQVKHLHLHENNLKSDQHLPVPGKIITKSLMKKLTKEREWIIEKGE